MSLLKRIYDKLGNKLWLVSCACDIVALLVSFAIVVAVKACLGMRMYQLPWLLLLAGVFIFLTINIYLAIGLYSSRRFRPFSFEVERVMFSNALATLMLFALLFLFHLDQTSRSLLLLLFAVSSLVVIIERGIWRKVIRKYRKRGIGMHKLLLIGSGETAEKFYTETVAAGKAVDYGFEYIGYVAYRENPDIDNYLGDTSRYHELLTSGQATEVIFASERLKYDAVGRMIATASRCGVRVSVIPSFNDFYPGKSTDELVGSQRMITLQLSPNTNPAWGIIKRLFDILGGIVGLVLGSPLMLVAAIMIKTASPDGPVIFKQKRIGKKGEPFTIYKLRTMKPNAEKELSGLLEQKLNNEEHLVIKIDDDPRIIKHGAFLRKYSIDELPQFWNVLNGTMSLVGPRPSSPLEVDDYDDWEWARLSVKPGLTCFWQVSGRSDIGYDEWMQLDLKYVKEQSFTMDVKLVLKTFGAVFKGRGAQ